MPDTSHDNLLIKMQFFITKYQRNTEVSAKLNSDHSYSLTMLYLYAKWLDTQPIRHDDKKRLIPRDDLAWLTQALATIGEWNGSKELSAAQIACFEYVIAKISLLEHGFDFMPGPQVSFEKQFSDTRGRICRQEYSITSCFTLEELAICLPLIISENRLIHISSAQGRSMGVIKQNDTYHFIDPHTSDGEMQIITCRGSDQRKNTREISKHIASLILGSANAGVSTLNAVSIQVYGITRKNLEPFDYPPHAAILGKLSSFQCSSDTVPSKERLAALHSILSLACFIGCSESVKFILQHNLIRPHINLEHPNENGVYPLTLSAFRGHEEVVELLINAGANVNCASDATCCTPLHHAAVHNHGSMMVKLVRAGANVNFDGFCMSPLMLAAMGGHEDAVRILLVNGANANTCDESGITAVNLAAEAGYTHTVDLLLQYGATISNTTLMHAISQGKRHTAQVLIQHGANINEALMMVLCQRTPLRNATILLELGATLDLALRYAVLNNQLAAIPVMISNGANPNFIDTDGYTPLMHAAKNHSYPTFRALIKNGANQNDSGTWLTALNNLGTEPVVMLINLLSSYIEYQMHKAIPRTRTLFGDSKNKKVEAATALYHSLQDIDAANNPHDLAKYDVLLKKNLGYLYVIYKEIIRLHVPAFSPPAAQVL